MHWPAVAFGAPASESGTAWPGTVWSQSAGGKPSSCLCCGWRHLGHSCGSRGSSLRSTRYSWTWSQTTGQTVHARSPGVSAQLETNPEEESIPSLHQAERCLTRIALIKAHKPENAAHMQVWNVVNCCKMGEVGLLRIAFTDVSHMLNLPDPYWNLFISPQPKCDPKHYGIGYWYMCPNTCWPAFKRCPEGNSWNSSDRPLAKLRPPAAPPFGCESCWGAHPVTNWSEEICTEKHLEKSWRKKQFQSKSDRRVYVMHL